MPLRSLFADASARSPMPTVLGLGVCVVLLAGLRALRDEFPEPRKEPGFRTSSLLWTAEGEAPLFMHGDVQRADLVVLGDSRVAAAIVPGPLETGGRRHVAFGWTGAANLETVLRAAERLPDVPLVLAIAPLNFVEYENPVIQELMHEKSVLFDPDAGPAEVSAWHASETARLIALGNHPEYVALGIDKFTEVQAAAYSDRHDWTAGIDRLLEDGADTLRCRLVPTISTLPWPRNWVKREDPERSLVIYQARIRPGQLPTMRALAARCAALIRELVRDGRRVACIRLPLSEPQRALEDERMGSPLLDELAAEAGVPYLDFGSRGYETYDGSHLNWPGAERLSRDLANWLDELDR